MSTRAQEGAVSNDVFRTEKVHQHCWERIWLIRSSIFGPWPIYQWHESKWGWLEASSQAHNLFSVNPRTLSRSFFRSFFSPEESWRISYQHIFSEDDETRTRVGSSTALSHIFPCKFSSVSFTLTDSTIIVIIINEWIDPEASCQHDFKMVEVPQPPLTSPSVTIYHFDVCSSVKWPSSH